MQQRRRNRIKLIALLAIFAVNALVSWRVPVSLAQFIDRIVRPCSSGATPFVSAIAAANGDLQLTPCTGRSVTINGVPITPGAGLPDPGSNGFVVRTALNTDLARTLTVSSPIVIANGSGVAGNPLFSCPTCVTSAAALTNFALMTGAGSQGSKTPAVTATLLTNGNISTPGSVTTGNAGGVTGALDLSGLTSGTVTITVAAVAGTWTLRLPTDDGTAGQFLQTDGAGVTSWQTVAAGVTPNATVGTVPYLSAVTVYSDSPITRLSATHLQIFAGGIGGADFDSSAPNVSLNNGRYLDDGNDISIDSGSGNNYLQSVDIAVVGDGQGNGNLTTIETSDTERKVDIDAKTAGGIQIQLEVNGATSVVQFGNIGGGGNSTLFTLDDAAKTITLTADAATGAVSLAAAAVNLTGSVVLANRITSYGGSAPTDGLLLIGSTGSSAFRTSTLGVTSPIAVANGSGTITVSCPTCVALGGTPGIAGNATLNSGSKDSAGKITSTGTGASTAVLTFSVTYARAPACVVTNETTSNLVRPVSTTTTLTVNATVVTGDSISYICVPY